MKHLLTFLALLGLCSTTPALAVSELQLVFEERVTESDRPGNLVGVAAPSQTVLRLGSDYFYVIRGVETRIYDFKNRRVIHLRNGKKVNEYPIYAIVSHRRQRLMEQVEMAKVLMQAGVEAAEDAHRMFELEHRYSMSLGLTLSDTPERRFEGEGRYIHILNRNFVLQYTLSDMDLTGVYSKSFERFLTYECNIHPDLREKLIAQDKVPSLVKFRYRSNKKSIYVSYTLESAQIEKDTAYTEQIKLEPILSSKFSLDSVINKSLDMDGTIQPFMPEKYAEMFRNSIDLTFYLNAMLVAVEFYLQTGADIESSLAELEPYVEADPNLSAFISALNMSSKSAAAQSLETLSTINRNAAMRKHILDATIADALVVLGRYSQAEERYIDALKVNPFLPGILKKLGDIYYQTYRSSEAWKCWETAIKLSPDHPMLESIHGRTTRLMLENPSFF